MTAPKEPARFDEAAFRAMLAGTLAGVVRSALEVRSGTLKPEDAADRDDASVRVLARILMKEHEGVETKLPLAGTALVESLRAREPELTAGAASDGNPRGLMVAACRALLSDAYAEARKLLASGALTADAYGAALEAFSLRWERRFLGDAASGSPH